LGARSDLTFGGAQSFSALKKSPMIGQGYVKELVALTAQIVTKRSGSRSAYGSTRSLMDKPCELDCRVVTITASLHLSLVWHRYSSIPLFSVEDFFNELRCCGAQGKIRLWGLANQNSDIL